MAVRGYGFYLRVRDTLISTRKDKIRIPKQPCNVLFILLMKFPHKRKLFLFIFETGKIVTYRKMSFTAISSHVKDKNSIFTACGKDMIFK